MSTSSVSTNNGYQQKGLYNTQKFDGIMFRGRELKSNVKELEDDLEPEVSDLAKLLDDEPIGDFNYEQYSFVDILHLMLSGSFTFITYFVLSLACFILWIKPK